MDPTVQGNCVCEYLRGISDIFEMHAGGAGVVRILTCGILFLDVTASGTWNRGCIQDSNFPAATGRVKGYALDRIDAGEMRYYYLAEKMNTWSLNCPVVIL